MERLIPTTILGKVQEAGSRENSFQPVSVDLYNLTIGGISKTMNSAATDSDHIPCAIVLDARGNGGGGICPTITGEHQSSISDYTAIIVEGVMDGTEDFMERKS